MEEKVKIILGNKPILLTDPHGFCIKDIPMRHCDVNANLFTKIMAVNYGFYAIHNRTLRKIPSFISEQYDMNRKPSRETLFRKKVDECLDFLHLEYNIIPILYDIHSFYRGSYDKDRDTEIVLLPLENIDIKLLKYVIEELEKVVKIEILKGSNTNDITYKAIKENKAKAILIEIYQDIEIEKIMDIGNALLTIFKRYYPNYP